MAEPDTIVTVDDRRLRLSNLDKVLYPATGTTKGEVLHYLAQLAPAMLPHVTRRPATRKRWPDGTGGQSFFQKNAAPGTPSWVALHEIRHKTSVNEYVLVDDVATLVWLGQTATLEIHTPQWRVGRTGTALPPDRLVLDLDPGPGAGLAECAQVARWARDVLTGMDLEPLPVTSGSKGLHLYAALDRPTQATSEQVTAVAREIARHLEAEHPDLVVSDMKKSLRAGKVFVDWSQNNGAKTTIAPYSPRGRERPWVAAPRTWAELEDPDLRQLDIHEVTERVAADGDLLAPLLRGHYAALEPTTERMAAWSRLAEYRAKRDPARTPEPSGDTGDRPGTTPDDGAGRPPSYVIQEHHATRLHWDFRLEHDGVLVSWALPRGEPTDPGRNHLAVQTEDHPMEYGAFEGTIPRGEYGAGEVTIWDSGSYEPEKWRDDEVIAVLHSERRGTRRLALIRTGGNQWLIHRTKAQPAEAAETAPAAPDDPVDDDGTDPATGLRPMLATTSDPRGLPHLDPDDWAFEMKWDGFRVLAHLTAPGEVRLVSRAGLDMTATFPELQALADAVAPEHLPAVLDGEVVALDADGRPSFRLLQQRANLYKERDVERARRRVGVEVFLFDVLRSGGRDLTGEPWSARREALELIVSEGRLVHVPPVLDVGGPAALDASLELRLEGVVAKRRASRYVPGRRSRDWLKVKHVESQEVVVVGWRPMHADTGRPDLRTAGALLLAVPEREAGGEGGAPAGLRFAGRVGTGFTEKERREIVRRLGEIGAEEAAVTDVPGLDARAARWCEPVLVGEVAHSGWTEDGRLRHPVWRGWRPDRTPDDI
ncbi:ATP-dependent DNA ligase [Myceligenerans pegani]|uniref:DNA ligase (ATP) n=1 Tax=Myceligenerans pegani TaxID=2776917 RepID=A0ABR9N3N9_9MICO|nr:ATP-dependent DNA ligase [Myceligenerans sp. TRM 65318]MBE1877718.1 ATP-dependent DNA ligase [Myceligenerans sp. TRM 65318]MBE3019989.1 ATP-dependent DNA ligase [Myceligenerans sp. TRM 65318]